MKLDSIEGTRGKVPAKGEIKVNSTPRIMTVKQVDLPSIDKKVLALNFEFSTTYSPDVGDIKINGELLYAGENNSQILKQWTAKKMLPEEVNIEVLNHLFRSCLLKVANIADDLQLPPPLAMPRVAPKQKAVEGVA
jgi:hypothetical protein